MRYGGGGAAHTSTTFVSITFSILRTSRPLSVLKGKTRPRMTRPPSQSSRALRISVMSIANMVAYAVLRRITPPSRIVDLETLEIPFSCAALSCEGAPSYNSPPLSDTEDGCAVPS